ncbi:carbohydrate-binding domain-containing protein [Metabacillus halosaccharovorans]|uniref:carbohydrate-binding domain-containing protein n=1 Tax=Metabacillus halosaccharovorans TaxID=930124 RepID=UPI002041F2B3|nr:carbohydrate-binding domain-containing protein [Metabacillus halosaccharovorans]MCM3441856.1 carbohydrate-binding domain-containing protein [Metabacillus halosaccharovorans]
MKKRSTYYKLAATLLSTTLLFACTNNDTTTVTSETEAETAGTSTLVNTDVSKLVSEAVSYKEDDSYTDWENEDPTYIELNGTEATFDSSAAVLFDNNVLTIKTGGTYVLSGQMDNGQIVVDAEDKNTVKLILNGVDIQSSTSSAIYVMNSEKTTISLVEGTENTVSDAEQYVYEDSSEDEPNAAIFSKDDLTINGTGTLIVHGNYNNGIASKDKLKITGGTINVHAVDDGIMGRDLVAVKEGTIKIEAGGDGIKSTNDEDTSKGTVALEGGTYDITSGNDAIQSIASLWITDGTYTIKSGEGSPETISNHEERMPGQETSTAATTTATESESYKGLKASVDIAIGGGDFTIDSEDDAVHSNQHVTLAGGEFTISTGDDGVHADSSVATTGGSIDITKSYEGIEGKNITIEDGEIQLISSDDGFNVAGGNDASGMDMPAAATEGSGTIQINGGYISVNAEGDGLDSNGSISMTDGIVIVNGPTQNMNGPLDYDSSFNITGGFIVAVGSSGMSQSHSEDSSQTGVLMTYPEIQSAGTMIHLEDSDGKNIVSFTPAKDYQSVFISSPELTKDASYTLYSGGTSTGEEADGLYTDGNVEGGTKVIDFAISETVTWLNESGVTEAAANGPGGGGAPGSSDQARPDMGNRDDMFSDLDEETRQKMQEIMEQQRNGTITQEEAQEQLAELGVEMPERGTPPTQQ